MSYTIPSWRASQCQYQWSNNVRVGPLRVEVAHQAAAYSGNGVQGCLSETLQCDVLSGVCDANVRLG